MIYFCCEDRRRALIRSASQPLNGIDHLEVVDNEYKKPSKQDRRQRELRVYFVKTPEDHAPYKLLKALKGGQFTVGLSGGERIKAQSIAIDRATYDEVNEMLVVQVTPRGDYSRYTLTLRQETGSGLLDGLDPRLAAVDFSFKVECPSDLDCRDVCDCPPERLVEPELDYLAKDFNSFRQLIFDRLALIAPDWRERNPADLGVTLVELMAYAGDYLSYRQDAIATEAYLGTARQRISLRRHARLLDYRMHEGCNARVWIQVRVKTEGVPAGGLVLPRNKLLESAGGSLPTAGTCFATRCGDGPFLAADAIKLQRLIDEWAPEVFEPMHDAFLHPQHNEFKFYTWAGQNCCLPKGATKATLVGDFPDLIPGLVLVFREVLGPRTRNPADADPTKRQAVRLTAVTHRITDPLTGVTVTEIEWSDADALAFPFCLSSETDDGEQVPDVSVALGNILLADHGQTLTQGEDLGVVPEPSPWLAPVPDADCDHCNRPSPAMPPARYHPRLERPGVTQAQALDPDQLDLLDHPRLSGDSVLRSSAGEMIGQDPRAALPAIRLFEGSNHAIWHPQADLIGSDTTAPEFVAEVDNDGRAIIRFGDDVNGRRPGDGSAFTARYRLGNGAAGNVGADAIQQIFAPRFLDPATAIESSLDASAVIESVTNPLPAHGGTEPETAEDVRQYAPQAFRTPRRCVTPEDYAAMAATYPDIQRAAASIRWTGSWHTIFLTIDRRGGLEVNDDFKQTLLGRLEPFRLAGHDLEVDGPRPVSLELDLLVCVADDYFRSDVKAALLNAFSTVLRADGSRGFFHPDNFTFGDPVELSRIYARAQKVAGVRHVEVLALRRQGSSDKTVPNEFTVGRLEIVRLENNRNFPDHGVLHLKLKGGQ